MFELQNIKYKNILNIDHLELGSEKITAISGPSGGGKTTLLRLLINFISPDSGKIFYKDKPLEKYRPEVIRGKIKMLGQQPIMFGETIQEEFQIAAEFAGFNDHDSKDYKELLKIVRLDKNLNDNSSELSGGEKQRLALARLLLLKPEVLLLDEPTASLDKDNQKHILEFLAEYAKNNGSKIIMVTHSPDLTKEIAQGQIIIANGRYQEGAVIND
ncbi:MAG: ATP-binding cassette domain-containing protein [Halarsenatibacteraceae bacterium]